MSDEPNVFTAATEREPWEVDGSYLIERYEHTNPGGVQWLVYRVEAGRLWMQVACKTRREAALYVAVDKPLSSSSPSIQLAILGGYAPDTLVPGDGKKRPQRA